MAGIQVYLSHEEYLRVSAVCEALIKKGTVKEGKKAFNHSLKLCLFTHGLPHWEKELGLSTEDLVELVKKYKVVSD